MKTIIIALLLLSTSIANAAVKDADVVSMCTALRGDAITFFQNLKNGQTYEQQMARQQNVDKSVRSIYTKVLNSLYYNTNVASFPTPADFGDAIFKKCHTEYR
jgi:hypothetical protein